ncbi:MAG TPA: inositol monophosphatase family protein [Terriglobia bacterium]|jgi:myo-inositol-1(or 4)-monophosphatase|nr:inositol monophosphatase family protein [Terriglobia bacterium]
MPPAAKKSHLTRRQWEEFFRVALRSADLSGEVLLRYQLKKARNRNPVRLKGRNDLVTGADLASCRLMKQSLKRCFPGHNFLTEEPEFSENNRSDFLWIIDPLDGTTFHNRGLPFFSSILALEVCGQTELGLVFSPFTGDMFLAGLGRGCVYWNRRLRKRRQVRVSGVASLTEALVGYSYGKSELHARHMATILSVLFPTCRAITRLGGAEIGYVASGACEAFIDNNSTPWDFAAVALLVREAGGRVTDFSGLEWTKKSDSILASNGLLHRKLLNRLPAVTRAAD